MSWFSNIINNKHKTKDFNPSKRWIHFSNGLILDEADNHQSIWITDSNWFEKWFFGVEERLGLILGKRLIQASSDSFEYSLIFNKAQIPKNKDIGSWKELHEDWMYRSFGKFSLYSVDSKTTKFLITNYANLYITIGYLSSAFEYINGARYKFHWNDSETSILLIFEPTNQFFPYPSKSNNFDYNFSDFKKTHNSEIWDMLSIEDDGAWYVQNSRKMIVSRDLFFRFEEQCMPSLKKIDFVGLSNYDWGIKDELKSLWWSASADSARELFIASSYHILIREDSDWKKVGQKHLSMYGLGNITHAESVDKSGGIIFQLETSFHLSLSCGILLACWERAYGMKGKLILNSDKNYFFVKISNSLDDLNPQY